jgi:hypothetical protein
MTDVMSYRGTIIDSHHYLVVTRIRARINITKYSRRKTKLPRYNTNCPQKPEIKKEYEERIQTICTELDEKEIDSGDWTCE